MSERNDGYGGSGRFSLVLGGGGQDGGMLCSGPAGAVSSSPVAMRGTDGVVVVLAPFMPVVKLEGEGEYVVPEGVFQIQVLARGGGGGATYDADGEDGETATLNLAVKPGDRFKYRVGRGGGRGQPGGDSDFSPAD